MNRSIKQLFEAYVVITFGCKKTGFGNPLKFNKSVADLKKDELWPMQLWCCRILQEYRPDGSTIEEYLDQINRVMEGINELEKHTQ